jgi:hypothetical protein
MRFPGERYVFMSKVTSLKIGIIIVACVYFVYTTYWLIRGFIWDSAILYEYAFYQATIKAPWRIIVFYASELIGTVGIPFRSVSGFLAVFLAFVFLKKGKDMLPSAGKKIGYVLLFEGFYWLALIPSFILGFTYPIVNDYYWYFDTQRVIPLIEGMVLCVEVSLIPILLFMLRKEVKRYFSSKASSQEVTKLAWTAGLAYLFVFWFNYSMQWILTVFSSSIEILFDFMNLVGFSNGLRPICNSPVLVCVIKQIKLEASRSGANRFGRLLHIHYTSLCGGWWLLCKTSSLVLFHNPSQSRLVVCKPHFRRCASSC